jgi:pSer/pThr/pTyr-binding forkhead associated (FHA) protein
MPQLKMIRGPKPEHIYDLTQDMITIGRGRKNEIIIHDNEISREHCRLIRVLYDYEIFDLNSTNGTFVNGQAITTNPTRLNHLQLIELGEAITLQYIATDQSPNTSSYIPKVVANAEKGRSYLVIRRISQPNPEVYDLDSDVISIGRNVENTICLPESEVSRYHLRLIKLEDSYAVEDLGSVNGTLINGYRLEGTMRLNSNDYIAIGRMVEMWFTEDLESLELIPVRIQLDFNDKVIPTPDRPTANRSPLTAQEKLKTQEMTRNLYHKD